jgi:hypothetical protein
MTGVVGDKVRFFKPNGNQCLAGEPHQQAPGIHASTGELLSRVQVGPSSSNDPRGSI